MAVYKRPLTSGETLEDNRFESLNTNIPNLGATAAVEKPAEAKVKVEAEAPAKKQKEKEVAAEPVAEFEKDAE